MATELKSDCNHSSRREFTATREKPFHFVDSGLPNVFLVGVRCIECDCGQKLVEIPALKQLVSLIARNIVMRDEALTGDEIRFLRKRLGLKSADFAAKLKLQPETLSRVENGKQTVGEKSDSYIRLYYALASKDPALLDAIKEAFDSILEKRRKASPKEPPKTVAKIEHDEWSLEDIAA